MKWRWPWRRAGTESARAVETIPESFPDRSRLEWLEWDGRTLRWALTATDAFRAELLVDGIVFQRIESPAGAHVYACTFDFSPTGNAELEFSITESAARAAVGAPWRVRQGAQAPAGVDQWTQAPCWLAPLAGTPQLPTRALPDVAIVVPIYNAAESVARCLAALERWTPSARWVLVDDASTDPAIAPLLKRHAHNSTVEVVRHGHNRGFTSAVNTGIEASGNADVVLLNSDTEVGPRWLEALRLAAYSDASIGTATAVSDNAGAFSVPELEQYCPIPERWNLVAAQRAVLQQAGLRYPELPTGNGFCLFIKREVIARIGVMDAAAFPAGYGEENDFCQRAIRAGFRNVIAGNVLVRHERSASFGDARRAALGAQGMAVLRARYPDYEVDVGATLYSFVRRVLDYRVRRTWAGNDGRYGVHAPRQRLLVTAAADAPFAAAAGYEVYVLHERPHLQLQRFDDGSLAGVAPDGATAASHDETIRGWLVSHAIEGVYAPDPGELATHVARLAADLGIPGLSTLAASTAS